jgi:cell division protein FtsN
MPSDYKPRPKRTRAKKKKAGAGWAWLLAGLLIGLFVAALVYMQGRYPVTGGSSAPPAKPVRPAIKPAPKTLPLPPAYDFYTLLPEMEVVLPEQNNTPAHAEVKPVTTSGTYVLQAGAFRHYQDADRLKASLALVGISAHIQKVSIDNDIWHRVRIGPYTDLAELNRVRSQLKQHNINAILLKVKSEG